ncbi:MAG: tetratricopeptide repeat protein [Candidatus Thorarchaeota archaeon]
MAEEEGISTLPSKYVSIAVVLVFVGGVILSWLGGLGYLPIDPVMTLGLSIMLVVVLICCSATTMIASYSQIIPEYSEMEIKYDEAKSYFDNQDYERSLEIFKALAGPKLNHKRALYYGALCYEALNDWENMKVFCKAYLELKPKDKEVWEMLNRAHKRLFEYGEAEEALDRANNL